CSQPTAPPDTYTLSLHDALPIFATDRVRTVRDLRGKAVAVQAIGSSQHAFTATIVAHVGLDPRRDISWVTHPAPEQMRLLADGKDRKSTRLNSSHVAISYAVFCL